MLRQLIKHLCNLFRQLDLLKFKNMSMYIVLSSDDFNSEFKDKWFLKNLLGYFVRPKTKMFR